MSRDASGNYTLPVGNPVVTATAITVTWGNTTMSDIATEMTDSLSRSGKGGMLAAVGFNDGTVSLPGISWVSDANSGFYRIGADNIGMSLNGVKVIDYDTSGINGIIGATTPAAGTFTTLIGTNIDGIIGANTPAAATVTTLEATGAANYPVSVISSSQYAGIELSDDTTTADGTKIVTNGNTLELRTLNTVGMSIDSSQDATFAGDVIVDTGTLNFGADTALVVSSGAITVTKSFHSVNSEGGGTNADDVDTINGDVEGDILIIRPATDVQDITFKNGTGNLFLSGDFVAASALDTLVLVAVDNGTLDWHEVTRSYNALEGSIYETGTFTGIISDAASAGNTASLTSNCSYTKIGDMVMVQIRLDNIDTTGMTGSNTLYIQGLPFTPEGSSSSRAFIGAVLLHNWTFVGYAVARVLGGATAFTIQEIATGTADAALLVSDVGAATSDIELTLTYKA